MSTKQEATKKVAAAEAACSKVLEHVNYASDRLRANTTVNGLGIFRDQFEVRSSLHTAKVAIESALKELEAIEWPTDADYDHF